MWEKEKLLVQAISPLSTMFSKVFFPRLIKRCHCVEWVNEPHLGTSFRNNDGKEAFPGARIFFFFIVPKETRILYFFYRSKDIFSFCSTGNIFLFC